MKVVAFNGSPRAGGNTDSALRGVAGELSAHGIETEIIHVGHLHLHGCIGCNQCARNRDGRCVLPDDGVNEAIRKIQEADGILLGAPTYYGDIPGAMKCFLDRVFFAGDYNCGGTFRFKVGAAVSVVRRSGGVSNLDTLNRYLHNGELILATAIGWPIAYGLKPGEVAQDVEGQALIHSLGRNMAWLLKAVELAKAELPVPEREKRQYMNLIR